MTKTATQKAKQAAGKKEAGTIRTSPIPPTVKQLTGKNSVRKVQRAHPETQMIKFTEKPILERFLRQMFNPDAVIKARGELIGVPNDFGDNVWQHTFSTVNTIKIVPDSTGSWWLFVTPDFRSHVHYSGGNSAATTITLEVGGGRTFVQRGTKNAGLARKTADYSDPNTTFSVEDYQNASPSPASPANNPGPGATFPLCLSLHTPQDNTTTGTLPKAGILVVPVATPTKGFIWKAGPGTVFNSTVSNGIQWNGAFTVSNPVSTSGPDGVYCTLWGGTGTDIAPGTDVCLAVYSLQGSGNTRATSQYITLPTGITLMYMTMHIVNSNSATSKICNLLECGASFNVVEASTTTTLNNSASGFVDPAQVTYSSTWEEYQHVSTGVLVQDDTALISIEGRVAGISSSASDFAVGGYDQISYTSISNQPGSYQGKSKDGCYGFLMPVNMADFQTWKPLGSEPNFNNENALVFAGEGMPASGTTPSPTFINCRIVSVWSVLTRDRSFGPRRESFVQPGMSAEEMFMIVNKTFGMGPQIMCNPSHEQWQKMFEVIQKGVKSIPSIMKSVGHAAVVGGGVALKMAPLLATLVGLIL